MASRKPKTTASTSKQSGPAAVEPPPVPQANPPRRNLPALIASLVFLICWLAYLAYVAWRTVG